MWTSGEKRSRFGLRTRKLFGTVLLLLLITIYSLVVMGAVASIYPQVPNALWASVFYLVAGLAWVPLAMPIIAWMSRPDDPASS